MKKFLILLILVLVVFFVIYIFINDKENIEFYSCVDGDTAWFIVDGKKQKVRILGIDAPESTKYIEDYGIEASEYTCNLLKKADNIYLEYDINSEKYDKYGRVLGWVFVDNNNLSELLLARGYAEVDYIYGNYKYLNNLCESQKYAYSNKLGIWNNSNDKYLSNYCNYK